MIRFEAGEEKKHHRSERRYAVEGGAYGVEHRARARDGAEHRLRLAARERVDLPERRAVEEAVLEDAVAEADAAERPRADGDAGCEFAEYGGQPEERCDGSADFRGEDYDAYLEDEEHHFLDSRHAEVRIGRYGIGRKGRRRRKRGREERGKFSVFHIRAIL